MCKISFRNSKQFLRYRDSKFSSVVHTFWNINKTNHSNMLKKTNALYFIAFNFWTRVFWKTILLYINSLSVWFIFLKTFYLRECTFKVYRCRISAWNSWCMCLSLIFIPIPYHSSTSIFSFPIPWFTDSLKFPFVSVLVGTI